MHKKKRATLFGDSELCSAKVLILCHVFVMQFTNLQHRPITYCALSIGYERFSLQVLCEKFHCKNGPIAPLTWCFVDEVQCSAHKSTRSPWSCCTPAEIIGTALLSLTASHICWNNLKSVAFVHAHPRQDTLSLCSPEASLWSHTGAKKTKNQKHLNGQSKPRQ